jgi:hypothetical protein
MSFLPKSRTQEYQNNSNGTKTIRCYSPANPHYYKDSDGNYNAIDLSHTSSLNNSNVGNYTLKSKNIHSLGIRQDDNKEKYIGIRPDETQDGSQQFEWTIISASVNGNNVPIDLSKNNFVDNNQVDLGNVTLFSTRRYARQMLHYTGSINDFKLEYKIDLTGLKVSGSKYTSSTTLSNSNNVSVDTNYYKENDSNEFVILDNDDSVKYKITEPVLLDSDFNVVETSGSVHTLKDNGDNTYNYTKYPASSSINNISGSVNYIDSTTVYSTAASDGNIGSPNATNWDTIHGQVYGTADTNDASEVAQSRKYSSLGSTLYSLFRMFMSFDTSGISGADSGNINLFLKSISGTPADFIIVGWDEGPTLSNFDFDNFTSDVYVEEIDGSPYTKTENAYNEYTLEDVALTAIGDNDTFDICIREHTHDYLDVAPPTTSTNKQVEIYLSDNTGTSKDPYIEVVEAAAAAVFTTLKVLSGNLTLKGGNLTIK